jgi:hypothetical protein
MSRVLAVHPAFTGEQLVKEFVSCLVKNRLLDKRPQKVPPAFNALVQLFAVERMHLTKLLLEDGSVATLRGSISHHEEPTKATIDVMAELPFTSEGVTMQIGFSVYATALDPLEWCSPELLTVHNVEGVALVENTIWKEPLEINPSGMLQMI